MVTETIINPDIGSTFILFQFLLLWVENQTTIVHSTTIKERICLSVLYSKVSTFINDEVGEYLQLLLASSYRLPGKPKDQHNSNPLNLEIWHQR
jgi:hypothetical protein